MHDIGFKIHTLHSWMGDAAEPSWAVVGCLLHSIHIFQKMNRRPRLGRAQLGYDPVKIKMSPRFHIFTPVDEDYSIQKKLTQVVTNGTFSGYSLGRIVIA